MRQKNSNYYTTGEVAKLCGVTLRTVINWIHKGLLHSHKLPGTRGDNRITKENLIVFMNDNAMPIPQELQDKSKTEHTDNKVILIVDDDIPMAKSISRLIRGANRTIALAHNGFVAGQKYQEYQPELMTLDLKMPMLDGFQVLELLKQRVSGKILVISALSDHQLARAIALGADVTMSKPFDAAVLQQTVNDLLA